MPWYHYHQNNSGGALMRPAANVMVEADSAEEANQRAITAGVYFDGEVDGEYVDCDCCGDRWSRAWIGDKTYETPDLPRVYGWSRVAADADGVPVILAVPKEGWIATFETPEYHDWIERPAPVRVVSPENPDAPRVSELAPPFIPGADILMPNEEQYAVDPADVISDAHDALTEMRDGVGDLFLRPDTPGRARLRRTLDAIDTAIEESAVWLVESPEPAVSSGDVIAAYTAPLYEMTVKSQQAHHEAMTEASATTYGT